MKDALKIKKDKRNVRHKRLRSKVFGTAKKPRLSVFRSLKYMHVQLVNDEKGVTILGLSGKQLNKVANKKMTKTDQAFELGKLLGQKALAQNIKQAVFDRGGFKYHGRIKAVAEGARESGLKV